MFRRGPSGGIRGSTSAHAVATEDGRGHAADADLEVVAFINEPARCARSSPTSGAPIRPTSIAPARGPPLWKPPDAVRDHVDARAPPAPAYPFDQRIAC